MENIDQLERCVMRPLAEAVAEVQRELNVRERCFPRWVKDGRLNRIDALDRRDRLATAFIWLDVIEMTPDLRAIVSQAVLEKGAATLLNTTESA
jgi:hypothetical protein